MPGLGDAQQGPDNDGFKEDFVILDDAAPSSSTSQAPNDTSSGQRQGQKGSSSARMVFGALNVVTGCAAIATAKNLINPANFRPPDKPQEGMPPWMKDKFYSPKAASQAALRNTMFDTAVLVGASATWYGVQAGMRKLRGKDDALNATVAGFLSAGLVGSQFIRPTQLPRAGIFAAVGATFGYYGWQQRQAIMTNLLQRQKELEQRHMHPAPGQERQELDLAYLRRLLLMEEQAKTDVAKSQLQKHGVVDGEGKATGGGDWKSIMDAAPWLQNQNGSQDGEQARDHSTSSD